MKIGQIIENARNKKKLSREGLSRETNYYVSDSTIKRVEKIDKYRISADKLIAICKVLDVDMKKFKDLPHLSDSP